MQISNNSYQPYYGQVRWETEEVEPKDSVCPLCSQRLSDFVETYFVGCPMCYKVFEPEVEKLSRSYHGTNQHFGKTPRQKLNKVNVTKELFELSQQEKKAVAERNYALAEEIKRKIDTLRGEN